MAKIDFVKYLALGAGAVGIPKLVANFGLAETLARVPMWGNALIAGITVGGIVLASAGVLVVDQLLYKK